MNMVVDRQSEEVARALLLCVGLLRRRLRQAPVEGALTFPETAALGRLDRGGPAVEEALGEELWGIVRPDREPPFKRFAPGISPAEAAYVVDRLEAL